MIALTEHPSTELQGELIEKLHLRHPTEVGIIFVSPAQGAVFAPLALKFVQVGHPFFFFPD